MAFNHTLTELLVEIEELHWFYQSRRKLLNTLLDRFVHQDLCITLDLGCSSGSNLGMLQPISSTVVGFDLSRSALAASSKKSASCFCQGDVMHLPFARQSADLILGLDILEHLQDDDLGMMEISRVLKPGGFAIFFVPAYPWLWSRMDEVAMHFRRYTATTLTDILSRWGLVLCKLSYWNTLLLPILIAYRFLQPVFHNIQSKQGLFELAIPPAWLNRLLIKLLSIETRFILQMSLPFGGTVVTVAQKPEDV